MSGITKILSERQKSGLNRLPCDGKPRFTLPEHPSERFTYGVAYEFIYKKYDTGDRILDARGIKRLRALNQLYRMFAKDFIEVTLYRLKQQEARK